ncbi:MAG: hypothetical protein LBC40_07440 [Dysgonamonadaceae bacterium]|jgi:hypothetical protein|nr:hypothetical protein [Dysgonamonadaceae bacterium]
MNKKYQKTDAIGNKNPFKVPEGYFENLNSRIQERLNEVEVEPLPVISLWGRLRPWVYMAAMFAGIALMFKLFNGELKRPGFYETSGSVAKYNQAEFFANENTEDVLDYLENRAIESNYRDVVYIGE